MDIPSISELKKCTKAQLEDAAFTLIVTIKAAKIHEPSLLMTAEKSLLSDIQYVLTEKG